MPAKKTPPIYARGRYVLHPPYDSLIIASKLYTNIAIRSLKDVYEDGLDPYTEYYLSQGLIEGQSGFSIRSEQEALANIITLLRDDNEQIIYVPDTYIAAFPNMADVKYNQVAISIDAGALPDYLVLTALQTSLANLTSSVLGVTPTVYINKAPSSNNPTPEQHDAIEAARLAAITNRETDVVKINKLKARIVQLEQTNLALTTILEDNGWLPT